MPKPHLKGHPWRSPLPGQTTRHHSRRTADETNPDQLRRLADYTVARRVRCAICTAEPGQDCRTANGVNTTTAHRGRVRVGRREANALADRLEAARP